MTTDNLAHIYHNGKSDAIIVDYIGQFGLWTVNDNSSRGMSPRVEVNRLQCLFPLPMPCTEVTNTPTRINTVKGKRTNMQQAVLQRILDCNFCSIAYTSPSKDIDREIEIGIAVDDTPYPRTILAGEHLIPSLSGTQDARRSQYRERSIAYRNWGRDNINHRRCGLRGSERADGILQCRWAKYQGEEYCPNTDGEADQNGDQQTVFFHGLSPNRVGYDISNTVARSCQ